MNRTLGARPLFRWALGAALLVLAANSLLGPGQPRAGGQPATAPAPSGAPASGPGVTPGGAPAATPSSAPSGAPGKPAVPAAPSSNTPPAGPGAALVSPADDPNLFLMPTYRQLFDTSPGINGTLAVLSAVATLVFIYLLVTISTGSMCPASLVDDITKLVISQQYDAAASLCRNNRHVFIASVILRCVENAGKEHSVILDMIDSEGRRRADIVWNKISYLADISNVSPMLGLLGTIVGMIKTFFLLPKEAGSINSQVLAAGIGEAMATTYFGLIVAILALFYYSVIKARATRTLAEAEQVVHSIADHVKRDLA